MNRNKTIGGTSRFVTGLPKLLFYARMSLGCAWYFLPKMRQIGGLGAYVRLLCRASKFTKVFFVHKLLRLPDGRYKLDFYMPAYPSEAFFRAMESKLVARPPRPATVVLSMTKACQYRCPHCYQGRDDKAELPLERLLKLVRELRDFGVMAWAVEGGDPLLKFDRLLPVLKELSGLEVWVNSTGTGATDEKIAALADAKVTGIMSSIHSIDPATHDAFTGVQGSWARAMNFLADCKSYGILIGFNTVLTDQQILDGEIDRIMDLAREHDCDYIQLIHPKSCGRWLDERFDRENHQKAVQVASAAQMRYNSRQEKHAPILVAQVFEESPQALGCTAGGIDRFYIGASGEVQPCEFLNISFGNLGEVSFQTAYERMRKVFPYPSESWPCVEKAEQIAAAIAEAGTETMPLKWPRTEKLTADWTPGKPTRIYDEIGIYRGD